MQRRDFLSTAAVGTGFLGAMGAPAWLSGCGAAPLRGELGARETGELMARLDRGLGHISGTPMGGLASAAPWQLRPELTESVLRLGAQALVVADVARSIPNDTTVPEELRGRLIETLPILDACTATYHRLLTTTPPAVRRNVDRHFRTDPEAAMNVAAYLDGHASTIGISPESRLRMRSNAAYVTTRIRRQSTGALVDDCVGKVESVVARSGGSLAALRGATSAGLVDAIWQAVDGEVSAGGSVPPPPAGYATTPSGVIVPAAPAAEPYEAPGGEALETPASTEPPGDSELVVGGILIGSGLAVFGIGTLIGLAAGNAALGAIIAATPGGALVITGIIVMIVGAVQNANAG